ncbi:MAG: hypothetical protein PPP58_10475 [Natronomonas sp.]
MSHSRSTGGLDYAKVAKSGFVLGAALFLFSAVAEILGHALYSSVPETVDQLLFATGILGIVIALFVPIIFGAVLPLIE